MMTDQELADNCAWAAIRNVVFGQDGDREALAGHILGTLSASREADRKEIARLQEIVDEQTEIFERWEPYILRVMSNEELTAELLAAGVTQEMQNRGWERVKVLIDKRRAQAALTTPKEA